jgi:hypothetical protein
MDSTKEFTLDDAVEIVRDGDLNDPRLKEYITDLTNGATKALGTKSINYLAAAVALVMATSLAEISVNNDGTPSLKGMKTAFELAQNDEFQTMMITAFKMSVGLAIKEGL